MNYELLKKLKDAGFPQREHLLKSADDISDLRPRDVALAFHREGCGFHRTFDLSLFGYPKTESDYYSQGKWRASVIFSKEYLESEEGKEDTVYDPTTDELIEELGGDFQKLEKYGELKRNNIQFNACGGWDEEGNYKAYTEGSTPKEALIRLYIALHENK